ncbi:MAG: hypothetical protein ABJC26_18690, partial [Gemmatimonadaceae bacterium]
ITRLTATADLHGVALSLDMAREELEGKQAAAAPLASLRPQPGQLDDFFQDNEKVIWDWPDLSGRLVEELR